MRGFFLNYTGYNRSYFYSRGRTARPSIAADNSTLAFTQRVVRSGRETVVVDHRNGLLLYMKGPAMYVCNPATRQWAQLPRLPFSWGVAYLVFDPVVSLHYEVFLFCKTTWHKDDVRTWTKVEWPPRVYMVQVYSSITNKWEGRAFLREGDATMVTMWSDQAADPKRNAVYFRGALYIHCRSGLIIRYVDR
jgi:hypothetical protein